jgi:hypothetical protein
VVHYKLPTETKKAEKQRMAFAFGKRQCAGCPATAAGTEKAQENRNHRANEWLQERLYRYEKEIAACGLRRGSLLTVPFPYVTVMGTFAKRISEIRSDFPAPPRMSKGIFTAAATEMETSWQKNPACGVLTWGSVP